MQSSGFGNDKSMIDQSEEPDEFNVNLDRSMIHENEGENQQSGFGNMSAVAALNSKKR